jgi:molecular chaperone IbpA
MAMTQFDLSPLFRSTIGFDRMARMLDAMERRAEPDGYPPYNIEKTGEDAYRISMAVAGFGDDDIDVTVEDNRLTIKGKAAPDGEGVRYLHRGIGRRAFERRFELADHILVTGASLDNGLLHVDLVREIPEAMKPRQIKIATGERGPKAVEQKVA